MNALLPITFVLFSVGQLFGAEVIAVSSGRRSIAISHESVGKWAVEDRACVIQNETDVVCGSISKTTAKGAIVKLDIAFEGVSIGDKVRKSGSGRHLAAETVETFNAQFSPRDFDLTTGLGVGFSFFYPMLHFQAGIGKHFAVGIQPYFYKAAGGTTNISAIGGMLTANYYFQPYFRGLWLSLGAGITSLSVKDPSAAIDEKASVPTGVLTVGYRARWAKGWNAGIGGGAQLLSDPKFTSVTLNSAGIQPLLLLDFGINF